MTNLVEDDSEQNLEDEVDISIYHDYFRELDIDTWQILTQSFVINPDPEHVSCIYLFLWHILIMIVF